MVRSVRTRIAGGLLAFPGEINRDRRAVFGLWRSYAGGGA
jgi:hypothetical protein